jgi:PAS domain S-box-containing protein
MQKLKLTYEELQSKVVELESKLNDFSTKGTSFRRNKDKDEILEKIFKTTPYSFVMKDVNSVYIKVNQSFCEFLGKTEEEIIGKTDYDFFPPDEAKRYITGDKVVMAGEPHEKEEWEVLGSSGLKWLKVEKTAIFSDTNKENLIGILCSVSNISELKKAELALNESKQKVLEVNAMKDKFFSIIGHDLRGPIGNILSFTEILIEDFKKYSPEKIERLLRITHSSARKTFLLLNNLLDWSSSQADIIKIYHEKVNLKSSIEKVIDLYQETIDSKNIKIDNSFNKDITIITDDNLVSTVFRNLISNAVKYTNEGGLIKIYYLEKFENNIKKSIQIIVEDNGIGINSSKINNLFKIDKSPSTKGTNGEQGTGLGLILSKEFIEKIGGIITVESEVGKGSKFIVTLNTIF